MILWDLCIVVVPGLVLCWTGRHGVILNGQHASLVNQAIWPNNVDWLNGFVRYLPLSFHSVIHWSVYYAHYARYWSHGNLFERDAATEMSLCLGRIRVVSNSIHMLLFQFELNYSFCRSTRRRQYISVQTADINTNKHYDYLWDNVIKLFVNA